MTGELKRLTARNDEIKRLYMSGEYSLRDLGQRFGIVLERVRQILMARGVVMNPLGKRLPAKKRAQVKLLQAASETAAERDRLREINAELLLVLSLSRATLVTVQDTLVDTVRFPQLIKLIDAAIAKATGEAT